MTYFLAALAAAAVPCVTLPPVVTPPPVVVPPAPPAAPTGTIATPANVQAVIGAAKPGDTIKLAAGAYPRIVIKGKTFAPPITLDPSAANMTQLTIDSSSGINVLGGGVSGAKGVSYLGYGFYVLNSSHVTLRAPKISNGVRGIVIDRSTYIDVLDPLMTGLSVDGINIVASQYVNITNASCQGFVTGLAHPDCVQMWSVAGQKPVAYVKIIGTKMDSKNTQGVTGFDHAGQGGFDYIVIQGSDILTSYPNAIAINNCRNCVVTDNVARTMPGSKYKASIRASGPNMVLARNVVK